MAFNFGAMAGGLSQGFGQGEKDVQEYQAIQNAKQANDNNKQYQSAMAAMPQIGATTYTPGAAPLGPDGQEAAGPAKPVAGPAFTAADAQNYAQTQAMRYGNLATAGQNAQQFGIGQHYNASAIGQNLENTQTAAGLTAIKGVTDWHQALQTQLVGGNTAGAAQSLTKQLDSVGIPYKMNGNVLVEPNGQQFDLSDPHQIASAAGATMSGMVTQQLATFNPAKGVPLQNQQTTASAALQHAGAAVTQAATAASEAPSRIAANTASAHAADAEVPLRQAQTDETTAHAGAIDAGTDAQTTYSQMQADYIAHTQQDPAYAASPAGQQALQNIQLADPRYGSRNMTNQYVADTRADATTTAAATRADATKTAATTRVAAAAAKAGASGPHYVESQNMPGTYVDSKTGQAIHFNVKTGQQIDQSGKPVGVQTDPKTGLQSLTKMHNGVPTTGYSKDGKNWYTTPQEAQGVQQSAMNIPQ
jgi:hypothetical protein